nr:unnamed protein product [Fasciola hepatica]
MPSLSRSAAVSFQIELRREQNHKVGDLLSYAQSNISKPMLENHGVRDQITQTNNKGLIMVAIQPQMT